MTSPTRHDPEHVAVIRAYLADRLRAESRRRDNGTAEPLQRSAAQVEQLPLTDPVLAGLAGQATRQGDDPDEFWWGPGWSIISRFDPRTTSLRELLGAVYEWNHRDEVAMLADDEDEPL